MSLLALDPGLVHPALALFRERRLVAAGRVRVPRAYSPSNLADVGERARRVALLCLAWATSRGVSVAALDVARDAMLEGRHGEATRIMIGEGLTQLVYEWPQVYRATRSKGDPNDLLGLVGVGAALSGMLGVPAQTFTPAQWIGGLPKSTTGDPLASPRGARVWSRLDADERAAVEVSHDAIDAVGLGLHALGRLERVRVFPGATP